VPAAARSGVSASSRRKGHAPNRTHDDFMWAQQQHIDTARMDRDSFTRFVAAVIDEPPATSHEILNLLSDRMWSDATEGMAVTEGRALSLTFEQVCKFLAVLNASDFETRMAFMFDLYDFNDSGSITMRELSDLVLAATPGSLVEQDLLTLMRSTEPRDPKSYYDPATRGRSRVEFFFSDYVEAMREASANGVPSLVEKICGRLHLAPTRPHLPHKASRVLGIGDGLPTAAGRQTCGRLPMGQTTPPPIGTARYASCKW